MQCSKQKTAAEGTFLKITVNENTGEAKRTASIKVTSTTATYTITVNQYAKGEVIVEGRKPRRAADPLGAHDQRSLVVAGARTVADALEVVGAILAVISAKYFLITPLKVT